MQVAQPGITDTHAHVNARQFHADREAVIERALAGGITRMICPGTDLPTSTSAVALATQHTGTIYAGVGIHPHDAAEFNESALQTLRQLAQQPGVVAIGEIGMDFFRNLAPVEAQQHAFSAQVALARELQLPIIVHNRDAHAAIMEQLRPYGAVTGVWHCFIGDRAHAQDGLDLGMYLSFAGPVTYPANAILAEVAAWAPLDRILVETDSPYLSPQTLRGRRNEPANVALTAKFIAERRGIPIDEFIAATSANAATLFGLPPAPTMRRE